MSARNTDLRTSNSPILNTQACAFVIMTIAICFSSPFVRAAENELANSALTVSVNSADGSYAIATKGNGVPILRARVGAEVDHRWTNSGEYPKHDIAQSDFNDALGRGRQATIISTGLKDRPDLICTIRLYEDHP